MKYRARSLQLRVFRDPLDTSGGFEFIVTSRSESYIVPCIGVVTGGTLPLANSERSSPLYALLCDDERERLISISRIESYPKGVTIIEEMSRTRDLYLLLSGHVSISMQHPGDEGSTEIINRLRPGEVLGEIAFVDGSPRSATVHAQSDLRIRIFPFDDLHRILDDDPKLGYRFYRTISNIMAAKIRNSNLAWRNLVF